ncbi:hypothetical protein [Flammeovirga pacifica]|uniref:Uncharacterized protein n=1 Tax=Flammeovirga pacifica TaxID=915059 RepID=A0A1S1Z4T2_FLAPC|nr:hypothetical protein [Flammeovirga pacifica]OHX68296.1 hypothetical protein NH26_19065 [Flammeovirga pacifica]
MNTEIPILLEWQHQLGSHISNNTLSFDNNLCEGKIEGFALNESIQILRFDFKTKDTLEFSGLDFKEDDYIPVFFEEPFNQTALELDFISPNTSGAHQDLDISTSEPQIKHEMLSAYQQYQSNNRIIEVPDDYDPIKQLIINSKREKNN